MTTIVYLNGEFLPLSLACVSVMDRGFLFGDGVYEVIPVFNQKIFKPHEHLARLQKSLDAIHIPYQVNSQELTSIFIELLNHSDENSPNKAIYLQITRGSSAKRTHVFPENIQPTLFIQCFAVSGKTPEEMRQGANAVTLEDIRWDWCHIKSINLLPNVLLAERAKQANAAEAILIRNGLAYEGTSSNLFMVQNQVIITPPANGEILCGITRDWILELAHTHHLPCIEAPITKDMLFNAHEVWMTGSIKEILPIVRIDDKIIGNGQTGSTCLKIIEWYEKSK